jgi:protein OPY2
MGQELTQCHPAFGYSPVHSLVKRCVMCPNGSPTCPSCKSDEVCTITIGDCNTCAAATCVKTVISGSTTTSTDANDGGPNVGAIVGGVVAGVAVIAIAVFCIWKFWLKGRRHEVEDEWVDEDYPLEKPDGSIFTRGPGARSSTHTVSSMASTVLTRASNIIQIAYIPGVTNRTNSSSPGLLVPPVPPIPIPTTPSSMSNSHFEDQHFFVPGDLRDSTYSDVSSIHTRRPGSIASSLARNSVATTVYRDSAVINPMPAQTIISAKAAVVSVKSGLSQSSSPALPPDTPPVPSISEAQRPGSGARPVMVKMLSSGNGTPNSSIRSMKPVALNIVKKPSSSALSGSSTAVESKSSTPEKKNFGSSSTSATQAAISEAIGLGLRPMTQISIAESHDTGMTESPGRRARESRVRTSHHTHDDAASSDEEEDVHDRSRRSLLGGATRSTIVQSPFTDDAEAPKTPTTPNPATSGNRKKREEQDRNKSPFEDENAV